MRTMLSIAFAHKFIDFSSELLIFDHVRPRWNRHLYQSCLLFSVWIVVQEFVKGM